MAPKKQKQSLADFLADETTGKVDWADDLDELPAGPVPKYDRATPRRGDDWLSSMPDRADRERSMGPPGGVERGYPPREELPLPTNPPYTAFIGNLSFEVTEIDVSDFFAPSNTVSVRLVSGPDGRPKGFGYVEFETLDGLKDALSRSSAQLNGRTVRVSVAEPRDAKGPGFNSAAEEATQWRRAGPLPPSEGPSGARRGGSDRPGFGRFESSGSGFDNMEVGAGGRAGFGSRFAASAPREPRRAEPLEPTLGDNASDWRTGKPVSEAQSPAARRPSASPAGEGNRGASFRRQGDATEIDEKYASQERLGFGSKFAATPPESPSTQKRPGFGFERRSNAGLTTPSAGDNVETWRTARRASGQPSQTGSPNGEPAQRKKLELKPRSTPAGSDAAAAPAPSTTDSTKGNNPFGQAKPVDATEREREIEAKMAQREKERKEEEQKRREKVKSEREKAPNNAPTGPKADRSRGPRTGERTNASSAPTSSARSSPAPAEKAEKATNGDSPAATADDATVASPPSAPKSPPPTGAWGGGRKPSGALAAKQAAEQLEREQKQEAEAKEANKAADEVTKGVEATTLNA